MSRKTRRRHPARPADPRYTAAMAWLAEWFPDSEFGEMAESTMRIAYYAANPSARRGSTIAPWPLRFEVQQV